MHNKKIYIFQCHASTGRPKPCKSFGIRDNRALQIHISDRKPPDEPAVCLHAENNNKSFPDEDRKRFFPPWIWFNFCVLFSLLVLGGWEEEIKVIVTETKLKKKPTFEMYTFFLKKEHLQYTVYSINVLRFLSVCVALSCTEEKQSRAHLKQRQGLLFLLKERTH